MSQPDGRLDLDESEDPFWCSYLHDRAGSWTGELQGTMRYAGYMHVSRGTSVILPKSCTAASCCVRILLRRRSHRSILAKGFTYRITVVDKS